MDIIEKENIRITAVNMPRKEEKEQLVIDLLRLVKHDSEKISCAVATIIEHLEEDQVEAIWY